MPARHLIVTEEIRPPSGTPPILLAREPGLLAITNSVFEAVEVDGEPFVAAEPRGAKHLYKPAISKPDELTRGPRTLNGHHVGGMLFLAASDMRLGGDERNPIRSDMLRIAHLAYALTDTAVLTSEQGALLISGHNSPAARKRFQIAMHAARAMRAELKGKGKGWWDLVDAESGGDEFVWGSAMVARKTGPMAYRLSAALFRPATMWGILERTSRGWKPPYLGSDGRQRATRPVIQISCDR